MQDAHPDGTHSLDGEEVRPVAKAALRGPLVEYSSCKLRTNVGKAGQEGGVHPVQIGPGRGRRGAGDGALRDRAPRQPGPEPLHRDGPDPANLEQILAGHAPAASLLHGDLWGGNWAAVSGRPVVFDPAVYYGDRETDLAMTRLFGGFGPAFYEAYGRAWPLPPGHERRLLLYQLYHVLNHLNLVGAGYLGRALDIMRRLNEAL